MKTNLFITTTKEDDKGNANSFHVFGNYSVDIYGDFARDITEAKVIINISSYLSEETYDAGLKCNESGSIVLTPGNSTLDFTSTADQLTPEKLGEEIAKFLGGDGTEFVVEPIEVE